MSCVPPEGDDLALAAAAAAATEAAAATAAGGGGGWTRVRNVLIVGDGAAEHALATAVAAALDVLHSQGDVDDTNEDGVRLGGGGGGGGGVAYVCPGNAGTFAQARHVASLPIKATDAAGLASFAIFGDVDIVAVLDRRAIERGTSQRPCGAIATPP